jgi:radical SAM superfamily enzyme YgiQ (UPF0313 family)
MKIALVNPPARQRLIRDYYCSKTSKSTYLFAPADLLMQGGLLAKDHELIVMDAVADGSSSKQCRDRLKVFHPDLALGLISAVFLNDDLEFYRSLKAALPSCKIFLSGEPVLEQAEEWLRRHDFIEGILLRFVSRGLLQYIYDEKEPEGLVVRTGAGIKSFPISQAPEYSVGRARQELFQYPAYFFSFAKHRRFATFLTDFGCPYRCKFCVMAALGYRRRNADEVEEELDYLKWLGIRELFLADQSFGAVPEHARNMMGLFKKYGNSFTAFVRPDQGGEDFWKMLKESGGHTVIMGLESGSEDILREYGKGYNRAQVGEGIRNAKAAGLRVVTTVIIGLPEDTAESIRATMNFVRELAPDFVSYNLAVPRSLTGLRQKILEEGLASKEEMDQAGSFAGLRTRSLGAPELLKLKQKAVRDFYLRPRYLFSSLAKVKSGFELYALLREGLSVLGKNV